MVAREQGAKRIALESSAAIGDSRTMASCRTAAPERMQNPAAMQLARRILRIGSDFCGSVTEGFLVGDAIQDWAIRDLSIRGLVMIAKKTKSAVGDCSKGRRN